MLNVFLREEREEGRNEVIGMGTNHFREIFNKGKHRLSTTLRNEGNQFNCLIKISPENKEEI